jgi:hypothetical protein
MSMVVAVWVLWLAAVVLSAGILYQILGGRLDRGLYTRMGRWVTVGPGNDLYLCELGADIGFNSTSRSS